MSDVKKLAAAVRSLSCGIFTSHQNAMREEAAKLIESLIERPQVTAECQEIIRRRCGSHLANRCESTRLIFDTLCPPPKSEPIKVVAKHTELVQSVTIERSGKSTIHAAILWTPMAFHAVVTCAGVERARCNYGPVDDARKFVEHAVSDIAGVPVVIQW